MGAVLAVMLVLDACSTASPSASAGNQPGASSQVAASTSPSPPQHPSPQIAVSGEHACALPGNGTVKCWGLNYYGELGDGTQTDPNTPAGDTLPLDTVTVIAGAAPIPTGWDYRGTCPPNLPLLARHSRRVGTTPKLRPQPVAIEVLLPA